MRSVSGLLLEGTQDDGASLRSVSALVLDGPQYDGVSPYSVSGLLLEGLGDLPEGDVCLEAACTPTPSSERAPTTVEDGPSLVSTFNAPAAARPGVMAAASATLVVEYGPFSDAGAVTRCTMEGRLRKLREMKGELEGLIQEWTLRGGAMVPYSRPSFTTPRSYDQGLRAPEAGGALTSLVLRMVMRGAGNRGRIGGKGGGSSGDKGESGSGSASAAQGRYASNHPGRRSVPMGQLQWVKVLFGMRSRNGAVPRALSTVSEAIFPLSSLPTQPSAHELPPYMRSLPSLGPVPEAPSSLNPPPSMQEPSDFPILQSMAPLPLTLPSLPLLSEVPTTGYPPLLTPEAPLPPGEPDVGLQSPGYAPGYRALAGLPESALTSPRPPSPSGPPLAHQHSPGSRHLTPPQSFQGSPLSPLPRVHLPAGPLSALGTPPAHPRGPAWSGYESNGPQHGRHNWQFKPKHRECGSQGGPPQGPCMPPRSYTASAAASIPRDSADQPTRSPAAPIPYVAANEPWHTPGMPPRSYTVSATAAGPRYSVGTPPKRSLPTVTDHPVTVSMAEREQWRTSGMPPRSHTVTSAAADPRYTTGMPPRCVALPAATHHPLAAPIPEAQQWCASGMPPRSYTVSASAAHPRYTAGVPSRRALPNELHHPGTGEEQWRTAGMPPRSFTASASAGNHGDWQTAVKLAPSKSQTAPLSPSQAVPAGSGGQRLAPAIPSRSHTVSAAAGECWHTAGAPSELYAVPSPSLSVFALEGDLSSDKALQRWEGGALAGLGTPPVHPPSPLRPKGAREGALTGLGTPAVHPPSALKEEGFGTRGGGSEVRQPEGSEVKEGEGEGEEGAGSVVLSATAPPDMLCAVYCGRTLCTFAPGLEEYAEHTGDEVLDAHMDRILGVISEFYHSSYC